MKHLVKSTCQIYQIWLQIFHSWRLFALCNRWIKNCLASLYFLRLDSRWSIRCEDNEQNTKITQISLSNLFGGENSIIQHKQYKWRILNEKWCILHWNSNYTLCKHCKWLSWCTFYRKCLSQVNTTWYYKMCSYQL